MAGLRYFRALMLARVNIEILLFQYWATYVANKMNVSLSPIRSLSPTQLNIIYLLILHMKCILFTEEQYGTNVSARWQQPQVGL